MVQKTIENKSLGVKATIKPLTQRDLESFGGAIAPEETKSASQRRGANVRSAIRAAWFIELKPELTAETVGDQSPALIKFLGDWVEEVYREVTDIPPD